MVRVGSEATPAEIQVFWRQDTQSPASDNLRLMTIDKVRLRTYSQAAAKALDADPTAKEVVFAGCSKKALEILLQKIINKPPAADLNIRVQRYPLVQAVAIW
ncbi:hypothetical protein LTR62_004837 [Meristemomyces frigidus]|uniref:Uncharacterized protein n=1 Tax=Meristemomyces frigidus TaxID=1508187 RepID=A0AAN7TDE2_9PEZI|nr:hypothetical protein LTR62_004837 [Meristemomyces frigidus]